MNAVTNPIAFQPQKTILGNIEVKSKGTVSMAKSIPTFFGRMLNNPKMKTTESFPAIFIHDESEVSDRNLKIC